MLNVNVLTSYAFIVVALGTSLLAAAAGAVGCINVLKGESLIGDAIGHATFPGVVFAFMLALQRSPAEAETLVNSPLPTATGRMFSLKL